MDAPGRPDKRPLIIRDSDPKAAVEQAGEALARYFIHKNDFYAGLQRRILAERAERRTKQ